MKPQQIHSLIERAQQAGHINSLPAVPDRYKIASLAIASIATTELPALRLVGDTFFYGLVFYTTYVFAKPILSKVFPDLAQSRGLRIILAVPPLVILATSDPLAPNVTALLVMFMVTTLLVDTYLSQTGATSKEYPHTYIRQLLRRVHGKSDVEIRTSTRRLNIATGQTVLPLKTLVKYEHRLVVAFFLSVPFCMWGLALPLFEGFYPAPELILLVGAVLGPSIADRANQFSTNAEVLQAIDTEEQFTAALTTKNVFHPKWLSTLFFILIQFLLPVAIFMSTVLAIFHLWTRVEEATQLFAQSPSIEIILLLGSVIGVFLTGFIFSLYALWFWRTELYRLPAFLSYWKGIHGDVDEADPGSEDAPLKTRPPWGLVPPTLLWLILIGFMYLRRFGIIGRVGYAVYNVLWVCGTLFVGWAVLRWKNCDPQPVQNESRVLIGNSLVQTTAIFLALVWLGVSIRSLLILVVMTISAIFTFYAPDGVRRVGLMDGKSTKSSVGLFAAGLAIILVMRELIGGISTPQMALLMGFFGVAVLAAGLAILQTRIVDKHAPADDFDAD